MSWWDDISDEWDKLDLKAEVDELWSSEKDGIQDRAKKDAANYLKDQIKGKTADDKVKSDSAAIPNATQQTVNHTGETGKKGMNWQAIGAGVGLLGIAAKFMK
jgi:hypothetical protein